MLESCVFIVWSIRYYTSYLQYPAYQSLKIWILLNLGVDIWFFKIKMVHTIFFPFSFWLKQVIGSNIDILLLLIFLSNFHLLPEVLSHFTSVINSDRYWVFSFSHQPETLVSFLGILIHRRKNSVMSHPCHLMLGEDKLPAFSSHGLKKLWSMVFQCEWSTVTRACFIVLPAALIVPFATTVWSVLTTIALGWANALDWYAVIQFNKNAFIISTFV